MSLPQPPTPTPVDGYFERDEDLLRLPVRTEQLFGVPHKRGVAIHTECKPYLSLAERVSVEHMISKPQPTGPMSSLYVSVMMISWPKLFFPKYPNGPVALSIIAGPGAHSVPGSFDGFSLKRWPRSLDGYQRLEIALLDQTGLIQAASSPNRFPFPWAKEWNEDTRSAVLLAQVQQIADDLASITNTEN